jgi:hypothetical protein
MMAFPHAHTSAVVAISICIAHVRINATDYSHVKPDTDQLGQNLSL